MFSNFIDVLNHPYAETHTIEFVEDVVPRIRPQKYKKSW